MFSGGYVSQDFYFPLAANEQGAVFNFFPNSEQNGSVLLTGSSGSGKTMLLARMAVGLRALCPVIVIGPHDDLPSALGGAFQVTENGVNGMGVNPIPITFWNVSTYGSAAVVSRIIDTLESCVGKFGAQQKSLIIDVLQGEAAKVVRSNPLMDDIPKFNLESLVLSIQAALNKMDNARDKGVAASLIGRLKLLASMPIFTLANELDPIYLLRNGGVLDLSRMRGNARTLVVSALLGMLTEQLFSEGSVQYGAPKCRVFILIDEAKMFFGDGDRKNDPDHPLNILATEGRKYGASLIMASQSIEHFSEDFLGNAALKISFGPFNGAREKQKLAALYGVSKASLERRLFNRFAYIESTIIPGGLYNILL